MRHSLSLSRNFRRVGVEEVEIRGRKGLKWEVIPERMEAVNREIQVHCESIPGLSKLAQMHISQGM